VLLRRVLLAACALGALALSAHGNNSPHPPDQVRAGVERAPYAQVAPDATGSNPAAPAPFDPDATTTTTEPPPVTTTLAPQPQPVAQSWPVSLLPCGGDLPPCAVKQRESGGNYNAVNPNGCGGFSCGGAWQFDVRTWNNFGGYPRAELAPPEVQDEKARQLWAGGAGCGHWGSC